MTEYEVIQQFYGDRRASRSGVLLMSHLDEGLQLLEISLASELAKKAFCLHPIVQNHEDVDCTWSEAYPLAVEYGAKANAYLCRLDTDYVQSIEDVYARVGHMSRDCAAMLVADKVQNRKDFLTYHPLHARAKQLSKYFDLWLDYLGSNRWRRLEHVKFEVVLQDYKQ
jgi:hypothetical protein